VPQVARISASKIQGNDRRVLFLLSLSLSRSRRHCRHRRSRGGSKTRPRSPQQHRPNHSPRQTKARSSGGRSFSSDIKKTCAQRPLEKSAARSPFPLGCIAITVPPTATLRLSSLSLRSWGTSPCTFFARRLATWPLEKLLPLICAMKTNQKLESRIKRHSHMPRYSHHRLLALSPPCPQSPLVIRHSSLVTHHSSLRSNKQFRD